MTRISMLFPWALRGGIWNVRKSLRIVFAVLFLAIGATNAHADTYQLNFTGPSPFTATFNATAGQVTSGVTVTYAGTTYVLTNFVEGVGTGEAGCTSPASTLEFLLLTQTAIPGCVGFGGFVEADPFGKLFVGGLLAATVCQGCPGTNQSFFITDLAPNAPEAGANFSGATLVSTPEPSASVFLLCGLGLLGLTMRRRIALGPNGIS
jgi:hypothetical protein